MTGRKRGRKAKPLDWDKVLGLLSTGHTRADVCKAMDISMPTLLRRMKEPGKRVEAEFSESTCVGGMLGSVYKEAMSGKISAVALILRRLGRF
jgi:Helix-turn-helix domain of resolvase